MAKKVQKAERLAKNFHRTFIPERRYLGALLNYAADGGAYEIQKIADATGIPTGASSGKSIPTADYCRGMGLVSLVKAASKDDDSTLALTPFGRTVFLEDKFFKEPFTQWLAHLRLCNQWRGADTWFYLFCESTPVFGNRAGAEDMLKWLSPLIGGKDPETAVSPTIRMYAEEASFADCGAIVREKGNLIRAVAPIRPEFAFGYAAWLAECMELAGRGEGQVSIDELETQAGFARISGWSPSDVQQVLELLERKRLVEVDRHMHPWLVRFLYPSATLWPRLYEEFL